LVEKRDYLANIKINYPYIAFKDHEIHSYTLEEMKIKISAMLEHSRFVGAAIRLQRAWRKKLSMIRFLREISGSV
jgi:hypothetical protein